MANPLIKIDKGAKNHQHYTAHTTSSKTKPKRSNSHYSHHQHTKAAHAKSGYRQSRPKQSKVLAKHHSTPQHTTKKSQISSIASDGTTHNENRITQQYDPLTLLKTADHLLLEPGEYGPKEPAEQKNYLQQKQEQQLNNINLHAVNWGIDLLNKYYPVEESSQTNAFNSAITNQQGKCLVSQCPIEKTTLKAIFGAEEYRSTVYNDATGKPIVDKSKWISGATIGYGHKINSLKEWLKYKDVILTESEARKLADHDLLEARKILIKYITVPISQNVFNALLSRAYNGGYYAFHTDHSDNGSNFIVNWINSGKEPDPNNEQFRRAYQKFNTYLSQYSHGVENRRVIEEDMMKNDYNQHDTRYYCQRSIYYTSESICMSHRRRKK